MDSGDVWGLGSALPGGWSQGGWLSWAGWGGEKWVLASQ